ncbi:MAG: AmmeMemoRadiSam system protein B [Myxococcota bacterium]|nr:AmmeMemoRadiSam system protein B [Myxococcota bacterium]
MPEVRSPAVAGQFYPADPVSLRTSVREYLEAGHRPGGAPPKALIAPHAGYVYSGPIAGSAYAALEPLRGRIERVVLLGPAHRVFVRGLAAPTVEVFATPLGEVAIDQSAIAMLADLPQVTLSDRAHAPEHSLEVQLPFLQEVLGQFTLVPLVVGDATGGEVAEVLDRLWGGDETLIVVSSDLSHYLDYETARHMDEATSHAIEAMHPEQIETEGACGRIPVQGLLLAARDHGLRPTTVDLRNSGDTAGPRDGVVGYGAYLLKPETSNDASSPSRSLKRFALECIEHGLDHEQRPPKIAERDLPDEWRTPRACFTTLRLAGELRGCMGSFDVTQSLAMNVARTACRAAFEDPRFGPLSREEFDRLEVEISILGEPQPLPADSRAELIARLVPGVDGLIVRDGPHQATFLPDVWGSLPDPDDFVDALLTKAGLPTGHWSPILQFERYTTTKAD